MINEKIKASICPVSVVGAGVTGSVCSEYLHTVCVVPLKSVLSC